MKNKSSYINPLKGKSLLDPALKPQKMTFSFMDFDDTQGQSFVQWEKAALLGKMMEKIKEYNKKTIIETQEAQFKIYGGFPITSKFKLPSFITEDAEWAALRIQGKERIAGHIVDNVFYVVFLDMEHQFYPSEKKSLSDFLCKWQNVIRTEPALFRTQSRTCPAHAELALLEQD
jgi:hypothetical protein